MQRAPGQHDHLARVSRTRSRAGRGRRPAAARYRSRTIARCASRMEPAVRGARIEPAITTPGSKRLFLPPKAHNIPGLPNGLAIETLLRGTEFLDAEQPRLGASTPHHRRVDAPSPLFLRAPPSTIAWYVAIISSSTSGGGGSRRSRYDLTTAIGTSASTKEARRRLAGPTRPNACRAKLARQASNRCA